ncbi:MAG TPA: efflux RND transporter periplasmic adaptor subunit [Steroidobacteraceae bacterium]|nr:efflux RND transporter periplasmic adaptor subunit [Steroidobacteraceae bacterium]
MGTHDHQPTARGNAFLWGGAGLGVLLVIGLVTHGFGLFGRGGSAAQVPALIHRGGQIVVPEGSPLRSRLAVEPAATELTSGRWVLPGMVEADPARTAAVLTPLAGRIVALQVALGDRVTRGQTLVIIDSPDLAQAYDDDEKAADAYRLATKNLARQEGQLKIGAAAERDVDQARSDLAQASAEYGRTRARLRILGVAGDRAHGSRLLTVRAPVSGSVTTLAVSAGNMINDPTQPMMTIADLSTVWVTALVPEKYVGAVARGDRAAVSLSAYPGRTFRGTVSFVSDVLETDSLRDKLRIAFANPRIELKPNMFATVTLFGPRAAQVILPASALLMNNDRTTVFIATAPWTFERRAVQLGLTEGSSVAIDSGVKPGERVVVRGGILLND